MSLYGGQEGMLKKLDDFFNTPETATHPGNYWSVIHEMLEARDVRMGQLGMSNQPSHHIPYMYAAAGRPSKTQALTREILQRLYVGSDIGQGYCGDEDNGEMSG
jgi:putative alpha-1,2-mannosidase